MTDAKGLSESEISDLIFNKTEGEGLSWQAIAGKIATSHAALAERLERARAEVERWKERANDNGTEATKLEQSNGRLKAALMAIAHSHADKYGSTDGDGHARCIATAQAALTETSPTSGGLTKEG